MSKNAVYILDDCNSIVTVAEIRTEHLTEMYRRGWITVNAGLIEDENVATMSAEHFVDYLQEAAGL